jgi:hypothetical protein
VTEPEAFAEQADLETASEDSDLLHSD